MAHDLGRLHDVAGADLIRVAAAHHAAHKRAGGDRQHQRRKDEDDIRPVESSAAALFVFLALRVIALLSAAGGHLFRALGTFGQRRCKAAAVSGRLGELNEVQSCYHLVRTAVPAGLQFVRGFHDDLFEILRNVGVELAGRGHLLVHVLYRHSHRRIAVEGHFARQHLVQHDAQGIDVGLFVHVGASGLLRGEIVHGAHDGLLLLAHQRAAGNGLRNAEVRDLGRPVLGDHDVMGLYVPVDELMLMRHGERGSHLFGDIRRAVRIERSLFLDDVGKRSALDEFHDDVVDVALFAYVVHVDDIGMHETRRDLGFPAEALDEHGIFRIFRPEDLDGNKAGEQTVSCLEDDGHAAFADLVLQLVSSC